MSGDLNVREALLRVADLYDQALASLDDLSRRLSAAEKRAEEAEDDLRQIRDFLDLATVGEILPQLKIDAENFAEEIAGTNSLAFQLAAAKEEVERLKHGNLSWMIERNIGDTPSPLWWQGDGFSSDPNDGIRFAREADAVAVIARRGMLNVKATEHEWFAATPSLERKTFDALVSKMSPEAQRRANDRAEKMLAVIKDQCFLCVQGVHLSHSPLVGYICVGSVFNANAEFVKFCQCPQREPAAAPSPEGKPDEFRHGALCNDGLGPCDQRSGCGYDSEFPEAVPEGREGAGMSEQDAKPLSAEEIEQVRRNLPFTKVGVLSHYTPNVIERLLATIDHQAAQLEAARRALEDASKMCAFCRGSNLYEPHCYKCDDSGEDHVDCPPPRPCPNKRCIETRAALAVLDKGAKS